MKTKEKFLKYIYEMSNIGLIHYDEFNLIKKRIEPLCLSCTHTNEEIYKSKGKRGEYFKIE